VLWGLLSVRREEGEMEREAAGTYVSTNNRLVDSQGSHKRFPDT
jgi:hypothetical protein